MKYICLILLTFLLSCCSLVPEPQRLLGEKEGWMQGRYADSVQILLTSYYQDATTYDIGYGSSPFLLRTETDTFLIANWRRLGEEVERSINTQVPIDSYPQWWNHFTDLPRQAISANDTLIVDSMRNESLSEEEAFVYQLNSASRFQLQPLRARMSLPTSEERLLMIGCEYADQDADCLQRAVPAKMSFSSLGKCLLSVEGEADLSGFSGAPILDIRGWVVGILVDTTRIDGEPHLVMQPMNEIVPWLAGSKWYH